MRTLTGIGILILFALAFEAHAQKCGLQVGVWESFPEEKTSIDGSLEERKVEVAGFTAMAVNQKTKRVYENASPAGRIYFEALPDGVYEITVRKAGYKTTIQTHNFSCVPANDGVKFLNILVSRGTPNQVVARPQTNMPPPRDSNRYTVLGDRDLETRKSANSPPATRKIISGGVLNEKAIVLPEPSYPMAARQVRATGSVSVQVLINFEGNVESANAVSGHPLLRQAAVTAARDAKFGPAFLDGVPVKVSGVITYNFVP